MAKKTAISGEYIITVEDNNAIRVCQIFDNVKQSLREASESVGFKHDPSWNTRRFGSELTKVYGDGQTASIGEYTIVRRDNGSIETYRVFGNTIAILRKIAASIDFTTRPNWNTRTMGSKLVDFVNGDYNPADDDVIVEDGLVVTPQMTAIELQNAFQAMFGGHLRIKKGVTRCDINKKGTGIDISLNKLGLKEKTVFSGDLTVGDFIIKAKEAGLNVQVATNDDWVNVLDGFTLDFVGQIPNNTTKEKMEAILNR